MISASFSTHLRVDSLPAARALVLLMAPVLLSSREIAVLHLAAATSRKLRRFLRETTTTQPSQRNKRRIVKQLLTGIGTLAAVFIITRQRKPRGTRIWHAVFRVCLANACAQIFGACCALLFVLAAGRNDGWDEEAWHREARRRSHVLTGGGDSQKASWQRRTALVLRGVAPGIFAFARALLPVPFLTQFLWHVVELPSAEPVVLRRCRIAAVSCFVLLKVLSLRKRVVRVAHDVVRAVALSPATTTTSSVSEDSGGGGVAIDVDEANCAICARPFSVPLTLRCRHRFCDSCISEWVRRSRTCPMCRAPVDADIASEEGSSDSEDASARTVTSSDQETALGFSPDFYY
ncbi:MAG: hypothetical protein MHM6MM_002944 [Cercozoa sp. M6MM]